MALSAPKETGCTRALSGLTLGKAITGASFTGYFGGLVMINSSGNIVTAADTSGARTLGILTKSTESSPGVLGAVASGVTVEYEYGHEVWFKINSASAAAFDGACIGKNCTLVDSEEIGAASVTTNDVLVGPVKELETRNGVAGAWVFLSPATATATF